MWDVRWAMTQVEAQGHKNIRSFHVRVKFNRSTLSAIIKVRKEKNSFYLIKIVQSSWKIL